MVYGILEAAAEAVVAIVPSQAHQSPTLAAAVVLAAIMEFLQAVLAEVEAAVQVLIAVHRELMGLQTRAVAAVAATALEVQAGPVWSFYPSQLPATQV
jgi:hypothetical protein